MWASRDAGQSWAIVNRGMYNEYMPPEQRSPEYLSKFLAEEIERWGKVIKAAGITQK